MEFKIISPTVLLFGTRQFQLDVLPKDALIKVHKAILYFFPFQREVDGKTFRAQYAGLEPSLKILRSLSDFPITREDELVIYRRHILSFCANWFDQSRDARLSHPMYRGAVGGVVDTDIRPYVNASKTNKDALLMDKVGGLTLISSESDDVTLAEASGDTSISLKDLEERIQELREKVTNPEEKCESGDPEVTQNCTDELKASALIVDYLQQAKEALDQMYDGTDRIFSEKIIESIEDCDHCCQCATQCRGREPGVVSERVK